MTMRWRLPVPDFRVIAYDRRGFGRSSRPWIGYDYNTLADDLASIIEQLSLQDATLVGFPMAGGEIARYLSRHGGKGVRQAALISSVVPYMLRTNDNPEGTDASVFEQMTNAILEDRPKFLATFFKQFYGVGIVSHPVSEPLLEWSRQVAMSASLDCESAFATTDFRPDLPAF
jgi:non-heme chloroperoxidase